MHASEPAGRFAMDLVLCQRHGRERRMGRDGLATRVLRLRTDGYRLRIQAQDDGTPSLSADHRTDATFEIARPGGDTDGPILWAGSVRVAPRPPGAGSTVAFRATADDRNRAASTVAAAELFVQVA